MITISIIITIITQDTLITIITIIMMTAQDTLGEGEFGKVVSASLNNFRGKPGDGGDGDDF